MPIIESRARKLKRQVASSWRMDETNIKINGEWWYYYRAVDKYVNIVDFYLSKNRDQQAATSFFKKAIGVNGLPEKVIIDKSGANRSALEYLNTLFVLAGFKQKMVQALGWKSKVGAEATMAGQETWTMVRRGQVGDLNLPTWQRFYALAA